MLKVIIVATIEDIRIVVIHVTVVVELIISSVNQNAREVVYVPKATRNLDYWAFVYRLYHHFVNGIDFGEIESMTAPLIPTHFRDLSTKNYFKNTLFFNFIKPFLIFINLRQIHIFKTKKTIVY